MEIEKVNGNDAKKGLEKSNGGSDNAVKRNSLVLTSIVYLLQSNLAGYYTTLFIKDSLFATRFISNSDSSSFENLMIGIILPYLTWSYSSKPFDSLTQKIIAISFSLGIKDIFQFISKTKYGEDKALTTSFVEDFARVLFFTGSHFQAFIHLFRSDLGEVPNESLIRKFFKSFCILAGFIVGALKAKYDSDISRKSS